MKKTFMVLCFLTTTMLVFAQTQDNNTMTSSSSYNAYAVPSTVQMYFTRDYPSATNVNWMRENDWWRASYNDNGRYMHVYYDQAGNHFLVNRPVAITSVPNEIFTAAGNKWGDRVYSITTMTGLEGKTVYHVHLLRNEERISKWLDANGNEIPIQYLERGYWNNHSNRFSETNGQNR
jgi:hypothetical protein